MSEKQDQSYGSQSYSEHSEGNYLNIQSAKEEASKHNPEVQSAHLQNKDDKNSNNIDKSQSILEVNIDEEDSKQQQYDDQNQQQDIESDRENSQIDQEEQSDEDMQQQNNLSNSKQHQSQNHAGNHNNGGNMREYMGQSVNNLIYPPPYASSLYQSAMYPPPRLFQTGFPGGQQPNPSQMQGAGYYPPYAAPANFQHPGFYPPPHLQERMYPPPQAQLQQSYQAQMFGSAALSHQQQHPARMGSFASGGGDLSNPITEKNQLTDSNRQPIVTPSNIYPPPFARAPGSYQYPFHQTQIIVPNSEVCGMCEKPGASIQCASECKKFYHKECTEKMAIKTVIPQESTAKDTDSQKADIPGPSGSPQFQIHCENCLTRIQKCQHCQQQGQIGLSMIKCAVAVCNQYFHKKCSQKERESLPDNVKEQLKSPVFICGGHHCHGCSEPFRTDDSIIRCLKCVAAYHEKCKEAAMTKIQQITQKQFICTQHNLKEIGQKSIVYETTVGEKIGNERLGPQQPHHQDQIQSGLEEDNQKQEELKENQSSVSYQKMRTNLSSILESGELMQVQRQSEQANLSTQVFKNTMQGPPQGPPLSTQSLGVWKKLDPSETIVLNQSTLQKVNDLLSYEIEKRQKQHSETQQKEAEDKNREQLLAKRQRIEMEMEDEDDYGDEEQEENKEEKQLLEINAKAVEDKPETKKPINLSKILKKCSQIDSIIKRQKVQQEKKFEKFLKYAMGGMDSNIRVHMFE